MTMPTGESAKARIARRLAEGIKNNQAILESLNVLPDYDTYDWGTVIRITYRDNSDVRTFIIFKEMMNNTETREIPRWWVTGNHPFTFTSGGTGWLQFTQVIDKLATYPLRPVRWELMLAYDDVHTIIISDDTPEGEYPIIRTRDKRWVIGGDVASRTIHGAREARED